VSPAPTREIASQPVGECEGWHGTGRDVCILQVVGAEEAGAAEKQREYRFLAVLRPNDFAVDPWRLFGIWGHDDDDCGARINLFADQPAPVVPADDFFVVPDGNAGQVEVRLEAVDIFGCLVVAVADEDVPGHGGMIPACLLGPYRLRVQI